MPQQGDRIFNPRTGQEMTFSEMSAEELRIDSVNPVSDLREPVHVHPRQTSGAEVHSGELVFEVGGAVRRLGPGERIEVPPNTPHRFWTEGSQVARSVQLFRPALDIASLFQTMFALARDDRLDAKGMPRPLQLAVMVDAFSDEIRPVSPPWPLLAAGAAVLAPIARRRGYSAYLS